jgi:hypothetical protein
MVFTGCEFVARAHFHHLESANGAAQILVNHVVSHVAMNWKFILSEMLAIPARSRNGLCDVTLPGFSFALFAHG